jgi:hypothetical protein
MGQYPEFFLLIFAKHFVLGRQSTSRWASGYSILYVSLGDLLVQRQTFVPCGQCFKDQWQQSVLFVMAVTAAIFRSVSPVGTFLETSLLTIHAGGWSDRACPQSVLL